MSTYWSRHKKSILTVWILSLILYSGYIVQELANPDAIWSSTIYKEGAWWEISLGRFVLNFGQKLMGYTISPPFIVILTLFLIACSGEILACALGIREEKLRILAGLCLILSPHVQSLVTYYYCELYYAAALLLSSLSLYLLVRDYPSRKIRLFTYFLVIIGMVIVLGTYQSYVAIPLTGFLMQRGIQLCRREKDKPENSEANRTAVLKNSEANRTAVLKNSEANRTAALNNSAENRTAFSKTSVAKWIAFLVTMACSAILYLVVNQIMLSHYEIGSDASAGSQTLMGMLAKIPSNVAIMPYYFRQYFFGDVLLNNSYKVMGIIPRRAVNTMWLILLVCSLVAAFL